MIAITVHQPWASLIAQGHKRYEYRSWRPSQALLDGEPLVICASARHYGEEARAEWAAAGAPGELPEDLPLGAALCVVRVADHWTAAPDGYGWTLADVVALREPIAVSGRQRLWRLPADVEAEVRAALPTRVGGGA